MATEVIEQIKAASDDVKRVTILQDLDRCLFSAPGQPIDPAFAQSDFLLLCSLQSEDSPAISAWLLQTLADLCRRDDFYSTEAIRICTSKIETVDNQITKEAITAACIIFPVALEFVRKNPHDPVSRTLWDDCMDLKKLAVREVESSYTSVKLVALRFVQVVIVSFSMPSPAPAFRNLAKNASQQYRLAPSFGLNRVPSGHPVLQPEVLIKVAEELWRTQIRDRLLSFVDASTSSGNIATISSLMNICSMILQTRTQYVGSVVTCLSDFYQDYSDPPTRFERKSLAHTIQSTMDAILKYDIGPETLLLAKCRSGRVARGRKARELESARKMPQPNMSAAWSSAIGTAPGSTKPIFAPPPTSLSQTQTSEALSRIIAGLVSRLAKPNSNLFSGFALIARIAVELPLQDNAIVRLLELLDAASHTAPGKGLALMWLNAEYNNYLLKELSAPPSAVKSETGSAMDVDASVPAGGALLARFTQIQELVLEKMANSEHLPSLMLDLPELPPSAFSFLSTRARTSRSADLYLMTLKNLALQRPPYRQTALLMMLEFTKDENDVLQTKLLPHLKELMSHPSLSDTIVQYAVSQVELLLEDPEVVKREEEIKHDLSILASNPEAKPTDHPLSPLQVNSIVKKYLHLYLGLYSERPDLLVGAVEIYGRLKAEELRGGISRSIMFRVKSVGVDNPVVIETVVNHPENADKLALELCDANGPTPAMTSAVMSAVAAGRLDGRFVASVYPGLSREEAYGHFSKLIMQPQATLRKISSLTLARLPGLPLTPEELLIQLHLAKAPNGAEALKECAMWISMLFDDPSGALLKTDILFPALMTIIQTNPLPILFFRTLLLSISHLKQMESYALNLLSRPEIVDNKVVWADPRHKMGFVNTCEKLLPSSISFVLNLSVDKFEAVISLKPSIKEAISHRVQMDHTLPFDKQHFFADTNGTSKATEGPS
jgi:hypothetical protein